MGAIRIDANTHLGNLSGYYYIGNYNLSSAYPTQQGGANVPGFNALSNGQTQLLTLGDTNAIGPSEVNEFRVSYMRDVNNLGQASGGVGPTLASQGFAPASQGGIVPLSPGTLGVETVAFNSLTFGTTPFAIEQVNQNYQLQDTFSKVMGNHTAKFGFQGRIDHIKQRVNLIENGEFQFTGTETGPDFADFLIGLPNAYLQSYTPQFDNRSRYAGIFAQGAVELIARSQVPGNQCRIACLGMGPCEGPATQGRVSNQSARPEGVNFGRDLHVAELPKVVIVPLSAGPAEKDVTSGLHDTLALHYAEPLVRIAALAARRLQDRPARFLDLQEERIIIIG